MPYYGVVGSLMLVAYVAGNLITSLAQSTIGRASVFERCAQIVTSRKSVEALNDNKLTSFYLGRTVDRGAGR
jgi:hypothetical protein